MPQPGLDLDLPAELLLDLCLDHLLLVEALERDDELWLVAGAGHVDAAELALAEGAPEFERGERERGAGGVGPGGGEGGFAVESRAAELIPFESAVVGANVLAHCG